MSCRMKNRDKALRLPTIRRLRIAVTASSNVRSGCSAISANNQPACFSNGETLPPLGFAAELPSSLQRRSQLITELGLTSRSAATSCREAPPSTIAIARTRRSSEYGLAITLSFQKESRAPDSLIRRPLGIPRFEAGGICSSRPIHSDRRVKVLEFDTCVGGCKLPVGLGEVGIAVVLPSGDFLDEGLLVGNPAVEALGR